MKKIPFLFVLSAIFLFQGCALNEAKNPTPVMCTMEYRYGLTLTIKDQAGQPIQDAKITVLESEKFPGMASDFNQTGMNPNGQYAGLGEGNGRYRVKIEKAGYETQELTVNLEHDQCHVHPQHREIVLIKER